MARGKKERGGLATEEKRSATSTKNGASANGTSASEKSGKKSEKKNGAKKSAAKKSDRGVKGKSKAKAKGKKKIPLAKQFDRHWLYQKSVQEPEADVRFMRRVFKKLMGRPALVMREDFCGTGYLSCTWADTAPELHAFGLDIDPDPLEWGEKHVRSKLSAEVQERVEISEGNALDVLDRKADIVCALNFSWFCFHTRDELLAYFKAAYENLPESGLFILDIEGGPEAQQLVEEEREIDDFDYVWDQDEFDGIGNLCTCYIHFRFPDGSEMKRAFTYQWRLWGMAEMRDVLRDAGFARSEVYWEGTDKDGEGNGVFTKREKAENSEAWIAYVVAVKEPVKEPK